MNSDNVSQILSRAKPLQLGDFFGANGFQPEINLYKAVNLTTEYNLFRMCNIQVR